MGWEWCPSVRRPVLAPSARAQAKMEFFTAVSARGRASPDVR